MGKNSQNSQVNIPNQQLPNTGDKGTISDKNDPVKNPIKYPHNKIFYAGYNLGNDSVKLLVESFAPIRTASVVGYLQDENRSLLIPGSVEYQGWRLNNADISWNQTNKNTWLGGDNVLDAELKTLNRVYGNPTGKSEYSLHMFLSALALLEDKNGHRPNWRFKLAVSCHKPGLFSNIHKSLSGLHKVTLNGLSSEIEIEVVKTMPEGLGAAGEITSSKPKLAILDIGGGTTSVSHYQGSRPLLDKPEFYEKSGVLALYRTMLDSKQINGHPQGFTIDDVRIAVEAGMRDIVVNGQKLMEANPNKPGTERVKKGILLGEKTRFDITHIYVECLKNWLQAELKDACRKLAQLQDKGYTVYVIGGGSKLPLLSDQLKKDPYNFNIATNGLYADVEGLLKIAKK
ncbi:ParM/StbA family protein [Fischerella sp. PCC 9605]|uniref:ParM/StbA family protein n=1 Tax=Fischerella sp. PCC 9605 TaxID=1173024 RepID=UPI00047A1D6B|nr:hypothetical protein [Fischerella sp. PCC 9605]